MDETRVEEQDLPTPRMRQGVNAQEALRNAPNGEKLARLLKTAKEDAEAGKDISTQLEEIRKLQAGFDTYITDSYRRDDGRQGDALRDELNDRRHSDNRARRTQVAYDVGRDGERVARKYWPPVVTAISRKDLSSISITPH